MACYHAAFCGRGPDGSTRLLPNSSDLNFQGVLEYLLASPPIDYALSDYAPDPANYAFMVAMARFPLTLIAASVAYEWDHMECRKAVAKRAIFEMVLLAGATFDDSVRKFAGTALTEAGGGVHYSADYPPAVLDLCTASPAARLARWPGVLAEVAAAAAGAAQYAVIHRRFLEICCDGNVDEATLSGLLDDK